MSDKHFCRNDHPHKPDHIPTMHGEKGYCRACLEWDYTAETQSISAGAGVVLGLRWTPSSATEILDRRKLADEKPSAPQGALVNSPQQGDEPHPDGLEGGRWLWWKNERHEVAKGAVYRLLEYMWDRDSASYDALEDARVFESAVAPQTVRSYANKAKNALPSGFPWQLSADSVARQLTKVPAAKGA